MISKYLVWLFFLLSIIKVNAQENCFDSIDNDGDDLVDLNDPDCVCELSDWTPINRIPNPSFEEQDCCPDFIAQISCASDWINATSTGTCDYFYTCNYSSGMAIGIDYDPIMPAPDGDGWAGFMSTNMYMLIYREYLGACLTAPLESGVTKGLKIE